MITPCPTYEHQWHPWSLPAFPVSISDVHDHSLPYLWAPTQVPVFPNSYMVQLCPKTAWVILKDNWPIGLKY